MDIAVDCEIFSSGEPDRGFTVKAHKLLSPVGDALVEIYKDGEPYRRFLYPAYKVWNIAAHFGEIVTSEIDGNMAGYDAAGWTGFSIVHGREVVE